MTTQSMPAQDLERDFASDPILKFYRLIADCPKPQRADRSAGGLIPTRAFRFCEPMTSASAFGWYAFPPMDFSVLWDGSDLYWRYGDAESWLPLNAAQYPNFSSKFDTNCPENIKGYAPPFISAAPEPGTLKIWSGLFVKTAQDWSILVRSPANLPRSQGYDHYEGIVETDRWFGPLFTNLRLTKTDIPISFKREMPFIQIQPLHRSTYAETALRNFEFTSDMEDFSDSDWEAYHKVAVAPGNAHERERGLYAKTSRRIKKRT